MTDINNKSITQIMQTDDIAIINEGKIPLDLKALILTQGYMVARIERLAVLDFENVYIVVNIKNDKDFQINMIRFANLLSPKAVMFINNCGEHVQLYLSNTDGVLSLNDPTSVKDTVLNTESDFMTTLSSKTLVFESLQNFNNNTRYLIAKRCSNYDL